ncbi:MAG: hypothetical protein ACE5D6_02640, partial [Candidatus Zixiibacteriota bacterium]
MDISSASINFSIIYPEISLLVTAFVILILSSFKHAQKLAPLLALAGMLVTTCLVINQWGHQESGFFGMVTCDSFGVAFKLIFVVISILALLIAQNYLIAKGINRPEFY